MAASCVAGRNKGAGILKRIAADEVIRTHGTTAWLMAFYFFHSLPLTQHRTTQEQHAGVTQIDVCQTYLYGRLRHCRQLVGAEVHVGQVLVDDPVGPGHITVVLWRVFARQEVLHLSLVPGT